MSTIVDRLTELTRDLAEKTDDAASLMREHLEAARFYKTGSMPDEYAFNLKLAGQLLPEIEDQELRARIAALLHNLESEDAQNLRL